MSRILLRGIIVLLLSVCFRIQSEAQIVSPSFRHFTTEDGLPSSEVYVSLQDHKGNMWFGTDRGLARYNGYEFRTFTFKDGLTDNTVFRLYEDKRFRLWMLTYSGKLFFYENDSIIPFKFNDRLVSSFHGRLPYGLHIDSLDNITVVIRDLGELNIDAKGNFSWKFINKDIPGVHYLVDDIANGRTLYDIIWPSSRNMKRKILHVNGNLVDSFSFYSPYGDRFSAVSLSDKKLLFTLGKILYERSKGSVNVLTSFPGNIYFVTSDKFNNVLVGTENGIYVFDQDDLKNYRHHYLEKNSVTSFFRDREGGCWFSTIDNGVYYMTGYGIEGIQFNEEEIQKPISLATDNRSFVYAGCWNGALVQIANSRINNVFLSGNKNEKTPISNLSSFPNEDRILLSRTAPSYFSDGKFTLFKTSWLLGVKTNFIRRHNGSVICAGSAFILRVDKDSITHLSYINQRINCLAETKDHKLLVGSNHGVFLYNDIDNTISSYNKELNNVRVDDIKWSGNNLIFATKGKGLFVQSKDSIYKIDESDGLCSDLTNKLYVDRNEVWCITNKGISHLRFTENENLKYIITNIHNNDGLLSDEINDITKLNDTIYVATNSGVSFFDSKTDFVNHSNPPVYVTDLRVNNKVAMLSVNQEFPYDHNDIHIGFNGISFRSHDKIIYRYELIKGKDTISSTTTNREVEFLSLHPGCYVFSVAARNSSGVWSESPATFQFTIQPAWWQTWWFRSIILLLLIASIFIFYKVKVKRLKHEFEVERRQASLQLTAMRAQMNPHFIFNVMNSIRNYMQDHDIKSAEKYLTSFSKLVRYTLDNSELQEVTLDEELQALRDYVELEMQRFENGFEYKVVCEEGIDTGETMLLSMLLQPIVENSIKHGICRMNSGGKILIDIRKTKDSILIAIEDNGVGIPESARKNEYREDKHVSHGMSLIFERIKAYNKVYNRNIKTRIINLTGDNENSAGTRVEVELY